VREQHDRGVGDLFEFRKDPFNPFVGKIPTTGIGARKDELNAFMRKRIASAATGK